MADSGVGDQEKLGGATGFRVGKPGLNSQRATSLMQMSMAACTKRDQVILAVVASEAARFEVMHFQEARGSATLGLAAVPVPLQHRTSSGREDAGPVAFAGRE